MKVRVTSIPPVRKYRPAVPGAPESTARDCRICWGRGARLMNGVGLCRSGHGDPDRPAESRPHPALPSGHDQTGSSGGDTKVSAVRNLDV
jgi:hypothetical protein